MNEDLSKFGQIKLEDVLPEHSRQNEELVKDLASSRNMSEDDPKFVEWLRRREEYLKEQEAKEKE